MRRHGWKKHLANTKHKYDHLVEDWTRRLLNGETVPQIAEAEGIPTSSVYNVLQRLHVGLVDPLRLIKSRWTTWSIG